jgi:hypothetical protein
MMMMMDPVVEVVAAAASTILGHVHDVATASTTSASTASTSTSGLEAILSTMYAQTSAAAVVVEAAHGHSQPFWGSTADMYLTAGKSIAPPAQNLVDMGISTSKAAAGGGGLGNTATTAADALAKDSELTRTIREEMSKGWKFLDSNAIQIKNLPGSGSSFLPGFVDPASTSFLSQPETRLYPDYNETPETFVLMVKWASGLINVIDKLPLAAFCYALIEFFFLRPNLDTTKRQVLQEPGASTAESIATTGVRLTVFMLVALFTLIIFG